MIIQTCTFQAFSKLIICYANDDLYFASFKKVYLKRNFVFVIALAFFSLIDGYLLSAISLIGRAGISMFYTQYQFLKTWWKGALLVFIVWIVLFIVLSVLFKRVSNTLSNLILTVSLLTAISGLYLSYADFRNTLSHRWLGERFHLGVYLFWLGWIAITIFLVQNKKHVSANIAGDAN